MGFITPYKSIKNTFTKEQFSEKRLNASRGPWTHKRTTKIPAKPARTKESREKRRGEVPTSQEAPSPVERSVGRAGELSEKDNRSVVGRTKWDLHRPSMPQPWGSSLRPVLPVQTGTGGKNMGFGKQTGERSAVGCCEETAWGVRSRNVCGGNSTAIEGSLSCVRHGAATASSLHCCPHLPSTTKRPHWGWLSHTQALRRVPAGWLCHTSCKVLERALGGAGSFTPVAGHWEEPLPGQTLSHSQLPATLRTRHWALGRASFPTHLINAWACTLLHAAKCWEGPPALWLFHAYGCQSLHTSLPPELRDPSCLAASVPPSHPGKLMCSRATSGVDPFGWPIAKAIASPRGYATKEEKLESLLSVAQKVNCLSRGQPYKLSTYRTSDQWVLPQPSFCSCRLSQHIHVGTAQG